MNVFSAFLTLLPSRYSIRQLYIRVCTQRESVKVAMKMSYCSDRALRVKYQ